MARRWNLVIVALVLLSGCSDDGPEESASEALSPRAGSVPVQRAFVEGSSGRTIKVILDTCGTGLELSVVETASEVWVYAAVETETTMMSAHGRTFVLEEPLGDRDLIDGSSGEPIQRVREVEHLP